MKPNLTTTGQTSVALANEPVNIPKVTATLVNDPVNMPKVITKLYIHLHEMFVFLKFAPWSFVVIL